MSSPPRAAKIYIYNNQFKGLPKKVDFKLVEESVHSLRDGEYLAEAVCLRVNPDLQVFASTCKTGATVAGIQLAKVIESKNKNFPVGKYVVGDFGWRTLTIVDDTETKNKFSVTYLLPEVGALPKTLGLGVLGIPGIAAYFGFLEVCKPQQGDTVVVSAAAGAVGSHVGQIAKTKGCEVIGITGSNKKGRWLIDELGFDQFINYKTDNVAQKLELYAPDGIDCYFDNVGGDISSMVIYHMKTFGRICICGATSLYCDEAALAWEVQTPIKIKHVKMEGMHVSRWSDRWSEAIKQNMQWIHEGKLKYHETVTQGFENILEAFIGTLQGVNTGNAIVQI